MYSYTNFNIIVYECNLSFVVRNFGSSLMIFLVPLYFSALILEEVALDSTNDVKRVELLDEAEELHLESLKLARYADFFHLICSTYFSRLVYLRFNSPMKI